MGRFSNLPTLAIDFLKPRRAAFQMKGAGIDGGRNGIGESLSIEFSGGGTLSCTYEECSVQAPEEHEYCDWLAARLDGGFRFINVPILTDWSGPFPVNALGVPTPIVRGITHSDGSLFSDGSGYSQVAVWAETTADAALNAGVLSMRVYGASRELRWSDWFSIDHPDGGEASGKGWRAYKYWDVLSVTAEGHLSVDGASVSYRDYALAITPPLRQATAAGTRVEFARPRCAMKFAHGFTLSRGIEGFWKSRPTLQFTEAV